MKPSQDVKKNETLASSSDQQSAATPIPPSARRAYDKDVSFEEYLHRALETRNEEQQGTKSDAAGSMSEQINLHIVDHSLTSSAHSTTGDGGSGFQSLLRKKEDPIDQQSQVRTEGRAVITENEWRNASRAKRTASCKRFLTGLVHVLLTPQGPLASISSRQTFSDLMEWDLLSEL